MSKLIKTFQTVLGPQSIGPFSSARIYNGVMYVSGNIGIDPKTSQLVSDNVEEQAKQSMENLKIQLIENNLSFNHILKATIYLKVALIVVRAWTTLPKSIRYTQNTSHMGSIQQESALLYQLYPKMQNLRSKRPSLIHINYLDK
jgi:hypothetical protein